MVKVIVYGTPTCSWCDKVKDWLKENKVEFEYIDVAADQAKGKEMVEKSGQMGVPVIDIDGTIVTGFDVKKLKGLLKLE
tara:strand:- start:536 stop:772 length:237 start_codon:yes stop_codon:yes gene_type:complete